MIDYDSIVENLELDGIKNLLTSLDIPFRETDNALIMPTVCHHENVDEASWKLYYYKDSHLFYCFTEDGGMSIFTFLKHYYEVRSINYDWYQDILQVILNCSASRIVSAADAYKSVLDDYVPQKVRRSLTTYNEGVLNVFVKNFYPVEWTTDGITPAAMDKYNIRFSISQNKIIIPHYDIKGNLVGIRGRALNQSDIDNFGKYAPIQIEGQWYSHPLSLNLYGLDKNWKNINNTGIAFIFESEKSVLQFENFSMPNCAVASCGSNLNRFQIDLLVRYCLPREIVICYDREELPNEHKYFDKLYKMGSKYKNYSRISFIYDKGINPMKSSPSDCGEENFMKLFNERIKIR